MAFDASVIPDPPHLPCTRLSTQSKSRVDVHSVSEDIFSQLALLESEVVFRLSNAANGKRNAALAPPPMDTLRLLHPLCFAMPLLGIPGEINLDEMQKRQLGVFMHVSCSPQALRLEEPDCILSAKESCKPSAGEITLDEMQKRQLGVFMHVSN